MVLSDILKASSIFMMILYMDMKRLPIMYPFWAKCNK